jgi:Flp pilus assembly protein TadG
MRFKGDESGQVLVIVALCAAVLLGCMALAVDVGQIFYMKRQIQTAADAAAIAAALEISQCGTSYHCPVMQAAAKSAVAENGLTADTFLTQCATDSGTGLTLTLNNGPCALGTNDPHYNSTSYAEAVITKRQPTLFASTLGMGKIAITARAEAGAVNSDYCLFVSANNTSTGAGTVMTMNSGGQLTASCGIIVDSGATSALWLNSGSHTKATAIDVHGTYSSNNGAHYDPTPTNNAPAVSDPLSWVQAPTVSSCTSVSPISSKGQTLSAGTYCGLNLNSGSSLTLNPGVYVMSGYINVGSGATLSGNGVTIYFASGTLQANSGSSINLVAPTSGSYAGILIDQSASDSAGMVINSGSASVWQEPYISPVPVSPSIAAETPQPTQLLT